MIKMATRKKIAKKISGQKVYVGMSGGVDSSVSAALLVKAGYDVTGVFIKVWQPDRDISGLKCTWREDRLDAMRVAAQLGIKFITLDLEETYKREVVDYMIAEYKAGRTPNPDVMCNKYVKFGGFFDWAMKQGADFVATGHYAQVNEKGELLAGKDDNKDQSYFLWTLTKEQLARTLFPVGNIEKPQVRKLAKKFKLSTAEKKDSQGLCFIGKIDIKEFLKHYISTTPGDVLDIKGQKIGTHDGALFFTIGERRGFTIDAAYKTPHDDPYYVISKDIIKNTITVSPKEPNGALPNAVTDIVISEVNWNQSDEYAATLTSKKTLLFARGRYRAALEKITLTDFDVVQRTARIHFADPQYTISPGQSLVIYQGDVCLGGGIIQ
jgi:tRNA-specific 2-thiouridylase